MSQEGYQKGQPIALFAGEDINHLPFAIPPNVGAYGLNTDYYRNTLLKRKGPKRLDDRAMRNGSLSIRTDNVSFNLTNSIGVISWAPAASWAISLNVQMEKAACTGTPKLVICGTPGADGFNIYYDVANDCFVAEIESSGGKQTLSQSASSYTNDVICGLMLIYYRAQNGHRYYRFYMDTTLVENNTLLDNYTAPASPVVRFSNNGATLQTVKFWIDELRMWDLANSSDAAYNTFLAYWTTNKSYLRELLAAERADSRLTKYYRFNLSEYAYGSGFSATIGSGNFVIPTPAFGLGLGTREIAFGRNLVADVYDTDWPNCTALALWPSDFGECWVRFGAEIWLHVNHTSVSPATYATRCSEFNNFQSGFPVKEAWSVCRYRDRMVAVHPHVSCLHLGELTGTPGYFRSLVPYTITSTPSAADKGGGTGPGAGTYNFKFYFYNSATGVHSLPHPTIVSVAMVGGNAIELSGLSTGLRRPMDGVDKLRIFRSKNGGQTYYYVDDITLASGAATTYSGVGINQLDSALLEANSEQALRYDMADRIPYRARACFEHRGYLILVAPNENAGDYGTAIDFRDTYNNTVMWSEPDAIHLFEDANSRDVLPDISDFLIGGISVAGGALLAKRYSLVGWYGEGPSSWTFRHISHAHGCMAHNSIAAGDQYIYLLSDRAIIRVPVSLGAGSAEDISSARYKPLFDDIDPTKIGRACGAYHKTKKQYWVSFDTLSNGRVTVVFNEATGAISRWDLEIEAFCLYQANDPSSAQNRLCGVWRGYIVELDAADNEGANVDAFTEIITGTITSADAQSMTDSVRNWTAASHYGAVAGQVPFAVLSGLKILIQRASDYVKQSRTILYNTTDRIFVDTAWDWTPTAGDSYFIAGIAWDWRSRKMSPQNDPSEDSHLLRLGIFQNAQDAGLPVNVYVYADGTLLAPSTDWVFQSNVRYQEIVMGARGRELEIRFTNILADQPVEIEAIQLHYEEVKQKP